MKRSHAVMVGAVCMCAAATAQADRNAANKLGQMAVINQTVQPKPPKSAPGVNTAPTSNAYTTNNTVNGTTRNVAPAPGAPQLVTPAKKP